MLTSLRKQQTVLKFALWFVIIAFIITIFLVWGVGNKAANASFLMKVNGETVTYDEYSSNLERTRNYMRSIFGDNFEKLAAEGSIEKKVLEDLTNRYILIQKAEEMGITVSNEETLGLITSIPSFQVDGKFDQETYRTLLARNRMTPQQFEAAIRLDRLVEKVQNLITSSVAVSDEEVQNEFMYKNKKAVISYIALDSSNFVHEVQPDNESLLAYYNAHLEDYRIPKKIKVKYTYFDPADYKPETEVDDAQAESYFVRNNAEFEREAKVKASHILFRIEDWNNTENVDKTLELAKKVLAEIKGGANFAEMAKKYSDDSSSANGGELGYFTKGQMVPEFEEAAFALNPVSVSDIVKTIYGFHIIKVEEKYDTYKPAFDQVKDQIKEKLSKEMKDAQFREYVFNKYTAIVQKSNITAYNAGSDEKLPVYETGFFSAADNVDPISGNPDLMAKLFTLSKSEVSQVADIQGTKYIFEIDEVQESKIPDFEDVKANVAVDHAETEAVRIATAKAEEAAKAGDIEKAAEALNLSYSTTPKFVRNQQVPGIGLNIELADSVFKAQNGQFLETPFVNGSTVYIVQVKELIDPSLDDLPDYSESIKNELLTIKSDEALKEYLATAKEQSKIEINPAYQHLFN